MIRARPASFHLQEAHRSLQCNFTFFLGRSQQHRTFPFNRCRLLSDHNKSAKNNNFINTTTKKGTQNNAPSPPSNKPTEKKSFLGRILSPNNPLLTKPLDSTNPETSLAILSGHAAFLLMGVAYVTKDILHLRLIAMGSISLTCLFQYYRPVPLTLPLRWNALFFGINAFMATALIVERMEAERMDEEMEDLYEKGLFERRGFSKVEFCRLFGLAKKEVGWRKGEFLKRIGKVDRKLYLITKGSAKIERNGVTLSHVEENDFVGEMEFLRFMTLKEKQQQEHDDDDDNDDDLRPYTANVVIDTDEGETVVWTWDFDELRTYLVDERMVSNALLAYISHELKEKVTDAWDLRLKEKEEGRLEEEKVLEHLLNDALRGGAS